MTEMVTVVGLVGLLGLLAGLVLGWYLRRANDWCPHCGDQLGCEGCGKKAAWPRERQSTGGTMVKLSRKTLSES